MEAAPVESVLVANGVPPARNTTLPLGIPPPGGAALTVAVKVTFEPAPEGLTEETSSQEVGMGVIPWENGAAELSLGLLLSSPL